MGYRAVLVSALALGATAYACGGRTSLEVAPVSDSAGGDAGRSPLPVAGGGGTGGTGGPGGSSGSAGSAGAPRDAGHDDAGPPDAAELPSTIMITTGGAHSCALDRERRIRCWGANDTSQLGDGTTLDRTTPAAPVELGLANIVVAHDRFSCALGVDRAVSCWGYAVDQRLGSVPADPDPPYGTSPVKVPFITDADDLSRGSTASHACAMSALGVRCWGDNRSGQLARGFVSEAEGVGAVTGEVRTTPFEVAGGVRDVCVVNLYGAVSCSGGTPGNGQSVASPALRTVAGIADAVEIGIGEDFGCARLTSGGVRCWGVNTHGQLGDGTLVGGNVVREVLDVPDAYSLSVGAHHACAVVPGPEVRCWGANEHGQLGDGTTNDATRPVTALIDDVIEVAAGNAHTCARHTSGGVACWGFNGRGQLGNGTLADSSVPVPVVGFE